MIDLVCLVADKNMEAVVDAVLRRPEALGIRPIQVKIDVHPHRDSGSYHAPGPFLQSYRHEAQRAMVLLDRAWEGIPKKPTAELELDVDGLLQAVKPGWGKSLVIDPELEVWLFRRSPRLDEKLGWQGRKPALLDELARRNLWPPDAAKPSDPKATIEWALWQARKPRSSAIYRELAAVLGMKDCVDASFDRFRSALRSWFPVA
jgi:hypothetical protein